jgi:hypothetical protein
VLEAIEPISVLPYMDALREELLDAIQETGDAGV